MCDGDSGAGGGSDRREGHDRYSGYWRRTEREGIPGAIVNTVATAKGIDAEQLTEPLGEALDVDALIRVLTSGRGNGGLEITFEYAGRTVTVGDDGTVVVGPPPE